MALREDNPELFSLVHSNFVKKVGGVFEAGAAAADIVTSMTKLTMPVPGVSGSLGRGRSSRFVDPTTMDDVFQLEPDQSVSTSGTSLMGTDEGVITMGAVFAHLPDMMRNAYSLQEAHAVNGQVQPGMDSITIENKVRTLIEQSEVFIGPTRRRARAVQTATDPETGAVTGNSVILPYSVATTLGIPTEGIPATTIRLKDGGEVESLEHVQVPLNDFIQRMTMVQRAGYQREKALSPTGSGSADPLGDHRRAVAAYLEPLVSSATNLGQTVPGLSEAVAALNIPPPQEHKTRLTTAAPTAPEKRFAPEVMGQASFWQADPGSITSSILEAMQRSQFYSSVVGFMAQDSREKATAIGEATREGDLGGIVNVADVPHVIVGIEGTDYVLRNLSGKTKRTVNFPMTSAGEPTDWVDRNELAEMILPKGFSNAETATRFLRTHFEGLLQAGQHLPRATAPDRQLEAVEVAELSNALWRADSNSDNLVDTAGGNYIRMVQGLGQMAGGSDEEDAVTYILDFLTAPGMTPQERIGMAMYLSPQRAVEYTRWRRDREVRRLDGAEAEPPPVWASAVASGKRIAIRHTLGLEHLVGGQSEFSDGLLEGHLIGSSFLPSPLQLLGEKLPAYLGKSAEAAMGARAFNEEAAQSGDTISQVSMTGAQRTADEARDVRVQFPEYGTIGYPDSGKVWMVDTERSVFGGRYGTPFTATPARSISELLRKMTSTPAPVPGVMEALFQITQDDPLGDGLVNNRWGPALVAPSAAKELGFQAGGRNPRSLPAWRTDPVLNADVGYSFMSHLTAKYVTGDLATLIYAYLWGPGHVDHAQAMHGEAWKSQAPRDVRKVGELWIQRVIGTPDLPMVVGETR